MSNEKALKSTRIDLPDDIDDIYQFVCNQGWGDGLPVIPPTEERVHRMIDGSGRSPDEIVATVSPLDGEATVEKIAVNAVMAGCLPEYMPVLIAAVKAMAAPEFDLSSLQATTNPATPLAIINGPIRHKINVNCTRGCMGPGWRANATIGRAIRFILLNIGGGIIDVVDNSVHGMPGKYTFCFGEDEEGSSWPPLHVERGFNSETSTVTMVGGQATHNVVNMYPSGNTFIKMAANSMCTMGNNNMIGGGGEPLVVFTSAHVSILAKEGFSKEAVKQALFENARVALSEFPPGAAWGTSERLVIDGKVLPCAKAEDIMVVVAGADNPVHLVVIPTFGLSTKAVTVPIEGA